VIQAQALELALEALAEAVPAVVADAESEFPRLEVSSGDMELRAKPHPGRRPSAALYDLKRHGQEISEPRRGAPVRDGGTLAVLEPKFWRAKPGRGRCWA